MGKHPTAALSGHPRSTRRKQVVEKLPPLPSEPMQVALLLQHIAEALIGHATYYINKPWGRAAESALDDIIPLRDAACDACK